MRLLRFWIRVVVPVLMLHAAFAFAQVPGPPPWDLKTEDRIRPIGMDVTNPRLSWKLGGEGHAQFAYQVRAASSRELLQQGVADLWDSGRIESGRSYGIVYDGPPLGSRDQVAWQVRVWAGADAPGEESEWSTHSELEMGLLHPSDWIARWIAPPSWSFLDPLPVFVKRFTLAKPAREARLYITGLGNYVATINGAPVTEDVLTPGNTNYAKQVEYATYDVTQLLVEGENMLGVRLGNGLFNSLMNPDRWWGHPNFYSRAPRLIAQLEIAYTDSTADRIVSDSSWLTTLGPTTFSSWFGGEDYDARREQDGWDRPGADLSGWLPAMISAAPEPATELTWRPAPPVRVVDQVTPVAINEPQPGIFVFDMGVNFAGFPELRVTGPAGTEVTMRIGERLLPDGTVDQSTTGSPIFDRYTLSGEGEEVWRPSFLYHGFRYLEVTGLPSAPTTSTITGYVARAANPRAGLFYSSNSMLEDIHHLIDRAIQSNMMSIFTDCPDREKSGWLGDMAVIFGSITRNYDISAYTRTVVRNMAEAQLENGMVPNIAPEYTGYSGSFREDPNWGNAMILAPWGLYETYGDVRILEQYYPNMQRYLDFLTGKSEGNLLDYGLNDWASTDRTVPDGVIASYGYYRAAEAMSRIAAVLGRAEDVSRDAALTEDIGAAFHAKYLDPAQHTYAGGQQAADAVALDMGIVPQAERQAVLAHLVESIRASGNHIHAGIVTLQAVFRALAAGGRHDVIYDCATQTTHPSYGYQLVHGATALTEYWNGPTRGRSQNHMMLGAIDEWFTAGLAGIRQATGSVGYERLIIQPAVVGDLSYVVGTYTTPHGDVVSIWHKGESDLWMAVHVPNNTQATILVPAADGDSVWSSGGLLSAGQEGDHRVFHTGPGTYWFWVQ